MDIERVLGDFAASAPNAAERATFFSTLASNSELQTAVLQSLIVTDPEGNARSKHAVASMPEALSMLLAWYRALTEGAEPGAAPKHWYVLQFVPFVIEANFVLRDAPLKIRARIRMSFNLPFSITIAIVKLFRFQFAVFKIKKVPIEIITPPSEALSAARTGKYARRSTPSCCRCTTARWRTGRACPTRRRSACRT